MYGNRPLAPVSLFFSLISFVCHHNRLLSYLFTSPFSGRWRAERWGEASNNDVHLSLFCLGLTMTAPPLLAAKSCWKKWESWRDWRECKSGVQEIWSNQSALWRFSMILTFHATSSASFKVNIHLKMWWIEYLNLQTVQHLLGWGGGRCSWWSVVVLSD